MFKIYGTNGFVVQTAMMDMEFDKLKTLMPHVALNTTAAPEHVGEIEWKIRGPDLANLREKQLGQDRNAFKSSMYKSLGILCNCKST